MTAKAELRRRTLAASAIVGKTIRRVRLERGLTQAQVAGDIYTAAYISALENGLVSPSFTALIYVSETLGVAPEYLLWGVGGWFPSE